MLAYFTSLNFYYHAHVHKCTPFPLKFPLNVCTEKMIDVVNEKHGLKQTTYCFERKMNWKIFAGYYKTHLTTKEE